MLLSQYLNDAGRPQVAVRDEGEARAVQSEATLYQIALDAIAAGASLRDHVNALGTGDVVDLEQMVAEGRMLPPLTHDDPAHLHLTGTGLTHLGSASTRSSMHAKAAQDETDSMKMFRMGVEGGKPDGNTAGVQPEWFYKGTGAALVAPGQPLQSPAFALDGGEEPELAGLYVIAPDGTPVRIGFALANEFSDHVTERQNYLFLAHSKLRPCSVGPEMLVGDLPDSVEGISRIMRGDNVIFEKPFLSGEANMSHTIRNLEHHHFKYDLFRQPGDVHVHMFGTATLSFADGVKPQDGDVFEIEAPAFGLPLRNALSQATQDVETLTDVRVI
ncbi:Fumarylacetoacetate (FAA) hydrolase family protein [Rhodobacteraceae bacterium THAF1]|uniref:AraD1 family protein n=1 Tax=Palleronia sp. THAF1 TaxID=2587842 RepID=UPI000F3BCDCE|nr:AraD1 family protein [Palleronia sp. THAF1]QFU08099.1 Fumarylacetoacetate (FAA) hydrolase family protein [Palleronia sp. THAF1]VDC27960.1 Fumarylacetoacetate (FAA) hydrolase family protein [Rhodobacteraceae bacterium THAF1]